MEILSVEKNGVRLDIGEQELLILNAALNEVCNGITVREFETRIGASREEVGQILSELRRAIDQLRSMEA